MKLALTAAALLSFGFNAPAASLHRFECQGTSAQFSGTAMVGDISENEKSIAIHGEVEIHAKLNTGKMVNGKVFLSGTYIVRNNLLVLGSYSDQVKVGDTPYRVLVSLSGERRGALGIFEGTIQNPTAYVSEQQFECVTN